MVEGPPCCQLPQNCRTVTATGQDVLGGEGQGEGEGRDGRGGEGRGGEGREEGREYTLQLHMCNYKMITEN